ncbi:MAG: SDR family oxidoreductase [Emcibacter sp.]|nr:SDR family oxidoreductase [Emcibacter sp.]
MYNKLFCFGLGYTARHLIDHLKDQNTPWQFSGTYRSLRNLPGPAISEYIFNGAHPMNHAAANLSDISHMLISIPPQENIGDPVLRHHAAEISKLKNLKWLGLLSTTGIYGDRDGDWVGDNSRPAPTSAKGRQRLAAEQGWLKMLHDHQIPVHIFRLGSIYGPDKGPLSNLLAGRARKIIKPKQYFSRIHVADIAQVLIASMNAPNPGRTYNVVDNMPAESSEVLDHICDLLGRPPLPPLDFADAEMSPMMKIFYSENKRVRNDRLKQELGITLKYPTYKKGFSALTRDL